MMPKRMFYCDGCGAFIEENDGFWLYGQAHVCCYCEDDWNESRLTFNEWLEAQRKEYRVD
jgi:hypothetical protein